MITTISLVHIRYHIDFFSCDNSFKDLLFLFLFLNVLHSWCGLELMTPGLRVLCYTYWASQVPLKICLFS